MAHDNTINDPGLVRRVLGFWRRLQKVGSTVTHVIPHVDARGQRSALILFNSNAPYVQMDACRTLGDVFQARVGKDPALSAGEGPDYTQKQARGLSKAEGYRADVTKAPIVERRRLGRRETMPERLARLERAAKKR